MAKKEVFFRTGYNYDRNVASRESGLRCLDESRTVQSEKEEADINTIVRRFGLTGQLPQNVRVPITEDFVDIFDFQGAMNAVRSSEESFAEMPASVRERFGNDPRRFVDFCLATDSDGKLVNLDEMRKLGLAVPKAAVPEPIPAPDVVEK